MEVEIDYQFKTLDSDEDHSYFLVQQCVKNIIKNEGYIKYSVDKKVFAGDGGSFLGILYEVNIKGETEIGEKEHNLFLKIITPGEQMTMLSLSDAYKKELFVYCELSKVFKELQDEVNLPQKQRFRMVKCYDESTTNVIVLDNMRKKGYATTFRMDVMSLEYAELAVKELAKFHALSHVLKDRRPKYYERKIKTITQPFSFNEDMRVLAENMCLLAMNYLDEEIRKKIKAFIPVFMEKYERLICSKSQWDVLCHGDFRPSNILMKKKDGKEKELIPIDYQLIYHCCPVMDLMYLIFPTTDRHFRRAHLQHLKNLYHDQMRIFLSHFDLDIAEVYPKEIFEDQFKEKLEYGLLISFNLVPFLMADENEVPDITGDLAGVNFGVDAKYKDRMADIVADFIEWGYL